MSVFNVTKISLLLVLLTMLLAGFASAETGLKINEFMSSAIESEGAGEGGGRGTSRNVVWSPAEGYSDDWIEIYNEADEAIDMGGMYLTDDLQEPMKWQIPADAPWETTIGPKGYLLILADGSPEQGPLHVDFGLNKAGEEIGLFHSDGRTLIDSIRYDQQVTNVSLGRYPNAGDQWRFYDRPTPGAENTGAGLLGVAVEPEFSVQRGFYEGAFDVVLTCPTPGATIHYTLDSTGPPEIATPYTGPLNVYTGPIPVSATTCLRAAAFSTDYVPSTIGTHTYIFVDDVIHQPVMSTRITQDPVWGPQIHDALLEIPTISLVTPSTIPDEPIASPPEVPVSIEMIFPDGTQGFQANAGVERFGGQYTLYEKQALRISFKRKYGPSRLKFNLFDDTQYGGGDATDSFNQIILRNGSHDSLFHPGYTSKGVYTRNRYCFDRQMEMGHLSMRGKFVHVYLNGVYWGQYHLMERPTADFMAEYLGGNEGDYDIMKGRSGIFNMEGDTVAWDTMVANTNNYAMVQEYMDVDNYIDYMLLNFYGGNDHDWYSMHNWVAGRKREAGGKFMFFMWDNDFLFRRLNDTTIDNGGPASMFSRLIKHEEFKMRLADRAQKHFFNDGMLTPARVQADFSELTNRISRTIIPEYARWSQAGSGGGFTPDTLQQSVDWIKFDWGDIRTDMVVQQMRDAGVLPSIDAPTFSQHGGEIASSELLSMTATAAGVIWYTLDGADPRLPGGTDPRLPGGVPNMSHVIEYTGPINLAASTCLKARVQTGSTWSALNEAVFAVGPVVETLRITEIMYNPQDPNAEFVELMNIGVDPINIGLVRFTNGIDFTFPSHVLAPGEYVLVAQDPATLAALAPSIPASVGILGPYAGQFSNAGETIELVDAIGRTIQAFDYKDGWHEITDGFGFSLTIKEATSTDLNRWDKKSGWQPSASAGGSPGA